MTWRSRWRVDHAGEFRQHAVPGGLDDPAMMLADFRMDQFDEMRLEALVRAFLIRLRTHYASLNQMLKKRLVEFPTNLPIKARATELYDRTRDQITLDEIERTTI
jgi:hypothetical protein